MAEKVAAEVVAVPEVVEFEGEGYSVCCKRGRKEMMEDRYSAVLGLQGDQKQVILVFLLQFCVDPQKKEEKKLLKRIKD